MNQNKAVTLTASEAAAHMAAAKARQEQIARFEADTGRTVGDYPNAANIREWMRIYFGQNPDTIDVKFTFRHFKGKLPEINTAADAIYFGLTLGYTLTDSGRGKAYECGILSDDSPAVPIPPDKRKPLKANKSTETDTASNTDNAKNPRRTALEIALTELVNIGFYPHKGRIVADTASDAGAAGATVDTGTANAGGLNIADTIGAAAWGEIRLVIRPGDGDKDAGGITFHCGRKYKAFSWKDIGLHSAETLRGVLMLLARQGVIDRGKYINTSRRDFEAKRAREKAAGKMRGQVNKLNAKFLKHFPAAWGNPFFNDDGITKHHFQKIEMQRTS